MMHHWLTLENHNTRIISEDGGVEVRDTDGLITVWLRSDYAAAPDLLAALRLYVRLDNDHRAGCEISEPDWAECYNAAMTAISKVTSE